MSSFQERLSRLRGALPSERPGARGLERVARNPECRRLLALTLTGISPKTAAEKIYGEPAKEEQSLFALAIGNRFEDRLLEDGAKGLLALYQEQGRLGPEENRVVSIPQIALGEKPAALARRRRETERLLQRKLARDPGAPHLILKPRLPVCLLGEEYHTEPDALVASDREPFYRPVEIKSYPDRGGKTDPADTRSACRQAAVGVVALRHAAARLGARDPNKRVPAAGDLVLRAPGFMKGRLYTMLLPGETYSLEQLLSQAPHTLEALEEELGPGAALSNPATLDRIPNRYRESCREHCALAKRCKRQALEAGDPVLLGDRAREHLGACGTLERALELAQGEGAPPRSAEERALSEQLQRAMRLYQEVLPYAG